MPVLFSRSNFGGESSVCFMSNMIATRVLQGADPRLLAQEHFGLSPQRWQRLAGQRFWVTGAGTGYGRAIAVALAAAGSCVYLTGRRVEKLGESAQEMQLCGFRTDLCGLVPADITDPAQVETAARLIEQHSRGQLHGVVHCAAIAQSSPWPLLDDSLEAWDAMMRVNVTAALMVTRGAMPLMVASGTARALFLSSLAGWGFQVGHGSYSVSKAAVNSLAGCLAAECATRYPAVDVQMNVLEPGQARTEMNQSSLDSAYTVASMALLLLSHPPGGPNGRYFNRDGWHLPFGMAPPYERPLN